jgi:hypothetical protein
MTPPPSQPSPSSQPPPTSSRGITITRAVGLGAIAIAVLVTALAYVGLGQLKGPPAGLEWRADSGIEPPADFRILMFPATETVPILDRPGGVQIGVLDRTLANALTDSKLSSQSLPPGSAAPSLSSSRPHPRRPRASENSRSSSPLA